MSAVDVLAVMDSAVQSVAYLSEVRKDDGMTVAAGVYALESKEIAQARAAVAELIEAASNVRGAASQEDWRRLTAALAAVGAKP